jgi:hypothetical protein
MSTVKTTFDTPAVGSEAAARDRTRELLGQVMVAGRVKACPRSCGSALGSLGESVDEEVKEQLEALVGVIVGEVVGEVHEVREALGREGREVVAGHDAGFVWRGLVGWWLAAFAGLVQGEADDDRDQELLAGDGELVRHPACAEDRQDAVGVAQGVGAHRDAPDRES